MAGPRISRASRLAAVALAGALSAWTVEASATVDEATGGAHRPLPTASDLPPGPVKRSILDLQTAAGEDGKLVDKPVREAIRAADRAAGARAAGDQLHGGLLVRLAKQWVAAGKAVLSAVTVEKKAEAAAEKVHDLTTKLQRAEALLSEQQGRLGRLQAELKKAQAKVDAAKASAAGREQKRLGKKKRGKGGKR